MSNIKRAAIITPYGLFNYGNRLQNHAVDKALKSRGFDVETLILKPKYPLPVFRDLVLGIGHRLRLRGFISDKYRSFLEFDRRLSTRRVWSDAHLARLGEAYDLYVVGSDQIWNPYRSNLQGAEYGNFVKCGRKVALAPSFGIERLSGDATPDIESLLSSFHSLSVREEAGQAIIQKSTGVKVPVLIDPTLSLDREEWSENATGRLRPEDPYLFVYLLGDYAPSVYDAIDSYAASKGLTVVQIMRREVRQYYSAGPQDFIGLIEGASDVIADSFHAAVFALLFDVPFHLVERPGPQSMHSRFDTLVKTLRLQIAEDSGFKWNTLLPPERFELDRILTEQRSIYENYLDDALGGL